MRRINFLPVRSRAGRTFSAGVRQLLLVLVALVGVALVIQFISTALEQSNSRTQDKRTINDGEAPPRDIPKGL